ncbi:MULTISPECIES: nicotinate-nucleotide adenylyltransferase [Methylobacterium]|uniref:Probable nicotinate-nucleotide adenylyltransferase n=1 Tax=Methylobacterium longum TaxID=767694 RepID=A0ABT8AI15_9HYPH|nr:MULTISPECIES: nicotinate-nucleotide adenylyltransferase [Methylobacterium]MDN3569101.1 nicotinate-nucleotide adenylyltransferase [Methylobacterium longum]GJE10511.1 Nicotinate-nucleotide adenylyltransferase [Methylobacterium longum]
MRLTLPPSAPGMRIGLYGGSFNPAHLGHRHVTVMALRRLGLDRVWWLVSPGNPLKNRNALPPVVTRCAQAQRVARHPRIAVTGIEAALDVRFTVQTLRFLVHRRPGVHFVWIMGADSLGTFHRWKGFAEIARLVPIAVIDRPGFTMTPLSARAARRLAKARLRETAAPTLALREPPAWVFLHGPRSTLSSTAIREGLQGRTAHSGTPRLQSAPDAANFTGSREA